MYLGNIKCEPDHDLYEFEDACREYDCRCSDHVCSPHDKNGTHCDENITIEIMKRAVKTCCGDDSLLNEPEIEAAKKRPKKKPKAAKIATN